ncbi:ATP-dependent nuclease [Rhodovibrionaceae bacterium A322]
MRLIKKIEISYLRSLYNLKADKLGDLNVVFGRNDSGKSNLLRALNLFFNDEIEPGRDFDFELDMSDLRKAEARAAKGRQFLSIKITFILPKNYKKSLGSQIVVKRQWNRDGDMTESHSPVLDTTGKKARMTRFLNEIDFTYIPAIKDLNVYADLIERVYGAASEAAELADATTNFVEAIGTRTNALTEQLKSIFGTNTRLAPPTELSRLFRDLDFAHGEDGHSLLRQKGDGIKARHLPELLRFINEKEVRSKFFLWGFEEPENSLDLGAAEIEAGRFAEFSSRSDTQIFVTSHSPAFYLSQSESEADIGRYFVTKQEKNSAGDMMPKNSVSLIDQLDEAEAKMEHAGLLQLPFVIRKMKEHTDDLKKQEHEAEELRAVLRELRQPTLFVEGNHDVRLFSAALQRVGVADRISVKSLGGTPNSVDALLSAVLKQGGVSASTLTMFLFDNDKAGRGAYRKIAKTGIRQVMPVQPDENTIVWALPQSDYFRIFQQNYGIEDNQSFFTAEFLYPGREAASLCSELVRQSQHDSIPHWRENIHGDYWSSLSQENSARLRTAEEGSVDWFLARGVPDCLKGMFAEEAERRGISTIQIDSIAETVSETLLSDM